MGSLYLIDAQVFPGSSGSPVFVQVGSEYQFAGVVGESLTQQVPVEQLKVAGQYGVREMIGLGVVYKPTLVHDLIRLMTSNFENAK